MAGNMKMRKIVQNYYDMQKLRIQMSNRLVSEEYTNSGEIGHESDDKEKKERKDRIENCFKEFNAMDEKVKKGRISTIEKYIANNCKYIKNYSQYAIIDSCQKMMDSEAIMLNAVKNEVHKHPLWIHYLNQVRGCGEMMSAVIISEIDMDRTRHIGSLWKYAGLDTVLNKDGVRVGRSKKEESLEEIQYIAKDGTVKTKRGITYNPFLKTKLIGVLSTSFIKCGGPYRKIYDDYKYRLANSEKYAGDKQKGHRENMARRYCVKMFLKDLYLNWYELIHGEKCPEGDWYEDKCGHPRTEPNYHLI